MPNRLLYRFLILSLAGLLMLLHSGVAQAWRVANQPVSKTETARKAGKATEPSETAVVKAALDEAVVSPALSFDFSSVTYLLFTTDVRLFALNRPLLRRAFEVPHFYSSYLRQGLGHLIAPNAP